ncbi:MAG: DinB family protein [Ktedonobacteraceae bacterium]
MARQEHPFTTARATLIQTRLELLRQFQQFGPEELTYATDPDAWSVLKIAYHIYLADDLLLQITRQIQEEDHPHIASIGAEHRRLVHETGHLLPLETVLAGMQTRREALLNYLADLPIAAWERPLYHAQRGEMRFYQWIHMLPEHDLKHIQQLSDLRAEGLS